MELKKKNKQHTQLGPTGNKSGRVADFNPVTSVISSKCDWSKCSNLKAELCLNWRKERPKDVLPLGI